VNDGGGNGAICVGIKVRTDTTKLSDMVIASFGDGEFCEIAQGIRPCGAFIFHISVKSEYKFQFLGVLHPCRCTDGGGIWHGGRDLRSPPPCQIPPPSVQR